MTKRRACQKNATGPSKRSPRIVSGQLNAVYGGVAQQTRVLCIRVIPGQSASEPSVRTSASMFPFGISTISVSSGVSAVTPKTCAPSVQVAPSGDEKSETLESPSWYAAL